MGHCHELCPNHGCIKTPSVCVCEKGPNAGNTPLCNFCLSTRYTSCAGCDWKHIMGACPRHDRPPEAAHKDEGKIALQYVLVFKGLDDVAKVGEFGAKKYGQFNFMAGMSYMRLLGSVVRHTTAFIRGEDNDPESGLRHLAHAIYDCFMLLEFIHRKVGTDDRFKGLPTVGDDSDISH